MTNYVCMLPDNLTTLLLIRHAIERFNEQESYLKGNAV